MQGSSHVKPIASLRRGLDVLSLIQSRPALTLKELHSETGVPKASLLRILRTMEDAGLVTRRMADGAYMPRQLDQALNAEFRNRIRLTEIAARSLRELRRHVPLSADVGVRDGLEMMTLESSGTTSDLGANRRIIDYRPNMIWSAMGRAYLSFCPEQERQELLRELAASNDPAFQALHRQDWILEIIFRTRSLGYSVRDPRSIGPNGDETAHQAAIGLPIHANGRVIACLTCIWLRDALTQTQVVARYLGALQHAVLRMGNDCAELKP